MFRIGSAGALAIDTVERQLPAAAIGSGEMNDAVLDPESSGVADRSIFRHDREQRTGIGTGTGSGWRTCRLNFLVRCGHRDITGARPAILMNFRLDRQSSGLDSLVGHDPDGVGLGLISCFVKAGQIAVTARS